MAGLLGRRSVVALLAAALSLVMDGMLFLHEPTVSELFFGSLVGLVHRLCVVAMALLSLAMLVTGHEGRLHAYLGLHLLLTLFLLGLFAQDARDLPVFLMVNLLPLGAYARYPRSLGLCGGVLTVSVVVLALTLRFTFLDLARTGLIATVTGLGVCLMSHYRESLIPLQRYVNRLEENVSALTRANSLSQDYARDVEEESRVAERQRLTRDIHDAIGYTMTNTIMAMEAVKMMVKSDPQRAGEHLEAARRNTEQGLATIKRILRDFRRETRVAESCFRALRKLVKVFSLSTGLRVRFEFGNADVAALDRHAECVYHFVQEGLINAFRHGRAERVTILLWDYGDTLRITLDDDGTGCPEDPRPGIGVMGMRERAGLVGGRVRVDHHQPGFRISMHLPKEPARAGT